MVRDLPHRAPIFLKKITIVFNDSIYIYRCSNEILMYLSWSMAGIFWLRPELKVHDRT